MFFIFHVKECMWKYNCVSMFMNNVFTFTRKIPKERKLMCCRTLFPVHREDLVREMFEVSDVDPQSRSYMLSVGEVGRLCHAYSAVCQREPDIFLYNYRDPENAAKVRRKNKILTELIEAQILQGPESVSS